MVSYQAPMLPDVDYKKLNDDFAFSLVDLEFDTMESCCDFLNELKTYLIEENLVQIPEIMVSYLCSYLGAVTTVHTVKGSEKLEASIIELMKHQADAAYELLGQYPINSTVKSHDQKIENLEKLRKKAPGSIVVQTMRLGRNIIDILEELSDHAQSHVSKKNAPKQTELFCSHDTLTKLMLLMSSKKCPEWLEELGGLSDHYVINQLAIQIGWLIGYFSHLDNKPPKETEYFEYGVSTFQLFRKHIFQLMEAYAGAIHKQEADAQLENPEAEALLREIHNLSEKTAVHKQPAVTSFQKDIFMAHATIEKTLIELIHEGYEIKIILMSLFYFWFTLEAPLDGVDKKIIEQNSPFDHMTPVIDLVKATVKSLPSPELSKEIQKLNKTMRQLKKHMKHPTDFDHVPHEKVLKQTAHVNTAIHTITSDLMKKNIHLQAVANALFSHWLRCSVFFGVSEQEWQKMDFYFPEIIKAVRAYL